MTSNGFDISDLTHSFSVFCCYVCGNFSSWVGKGEFVDKYDLSMIAVFLFCTMCLVLCNARGEWLRGAKARGQLAV